jgi:hypothetical protein
MNTSERLLVRVNDELVLDAGECKIVEGQKEYNRIIQPARTTLFHQILDYLKSKPAPRKQPAGTFIAREGVAAAAVTLRWGSYFVVLADRDKPVWRETKSPQTSRISDGEMARINIESSAAMAEWIDISRTDYIEYRCLVDKAVSYLPMPRKTSKPSHVPAQESLFFKPVTTTFLEHLAPASLPPHIKNGAEHHPNRMLANVLVNMAWRNGPIEDIHAGQWRGYPLDKRRITPSEEGELMRFVSDRMALGMDVCFSLNLGESPWPDQILSYLKPRLITVPSGWTLTESSREVRLQILNSRSDSRR